MHDSSEDGLDSDVDLDIDIDDEDDEEYDSDEHAAEDDSHVAEEDLAINDGPRIKVNSLKFSQCDGLLTSSKESVRASTLGRSLTDPSSHASIPRRATFPNLPGFAVPHAPTLEKKPSQPEPQKRKNETEATDSESRTSSHLSKRRKYSTEPSETFNHVSTDPPAPLKKLIDGLNLTGIVLYPEAVAKANEDFRNLSLAYTAEKASRQETFEAAVKRATRRANDAEHRLQDSSQSYADKIKANDEAHNKIVEALRQEVTALTVSLTASRESLKTASESLPLRAVLQEKEARLARHDQLCLQLSSEKEKLNQSQTRAALNASALEVRHEKLSKIIDKFLEGWEEVTMKIVKQFAMEMREESQAVKGLIEEDVREWKEIREMTDGLGNVVAAIAGTEKVNGVAESTTATALTTAAEPTTTTTTTTTTEGTAAAVVEVAVTDQQPLVKSDGP